MAAVEGFRLVPVPEASLLDKDSLADVEAFAAKHGIQLLCERVVDVAPGGKRELVAIIEEGTTEEVE